MPIYYHIDKLRNAISWATDILADSQKRHALCDAEFAAYDTDGSGTLELSEMTVLVRKICAAYELQMPREAKIADLYQLCDKSRDGTLQPGEFRNVFKVVVESALKKANAELAIEQAAVDKVAAAEAEARNLALSAMHEDKVVAHEAARDARAAAQASAAEAAAATAVANMAAEERAAATAAAEARAMGQATGTSIAAGYPTDVDTVPHAFANAASTAGRRPSHADYLASAGVGAALDAALTDLMCERPADPIGVLGARLVAAAAQRKTAAATTLQYAGNNFDGAVLGGRPAPPSDLDLSGTRAMELAIAQPVAAQAGRRKCDLLILISSAAGYERRRHAIRATYLQALGANPGLAERVSYRFLLGAPKPDQEAVLAAEQAEHGDLLQVRVPESYETLFPKIVASWRWAVATHDFGFWMHADDDSYIRLESLLRWLDTAPQAQPHQGLYAGYIWDGSEGRRTKPLRDPSAKSYMPIEQWPHDSYPPFASGCGFLLACDLIEGLVEASPGFSFFRVIDVPVGVFVDRLPPEYKRALRIVHVEEIRPYRPLPLFRPDTLVQHYMQPEEFRQFHERAVQAEASEAARAASGRGGATEPVETEEAEREQRIAAVYDMFVQAKVMRR